MGFFLVLIFGALGTAEAKTPVERAMGESSKSKPMSPIERVMLPVAEFITTLESRHTPAYNPNNMSGELRNQEESFESGFDRWEIKPGTDLIFDVDTGGEKPSRVGVSQKIIGGRKHKVRANVYGAKGDQLPSAIGAGASHYVNFGDSTALTSGVTYETMPEINGSSIVGSLSLEKSFFDRDKLQLSSNQRFSSHQEEMQYDFRASYNKPFGAKKQPKKKHRPWVQILKTRKKLTDGGLARGEEPEAYAELVSSYLAFADKLEISRGASQEYMRDIVIGNNESGKPLGLSFSEHNALGCKSDMALSARAHALYYYEQLQKKYPFHSKTKSLHVHKLRFKEVAGTELSVSKNCVSPGEQGNRYPGRPPVGTK